MTQVLGKSVMTSAFAIITLIVAVLTQVLHVIDTDPTTVFDLEPIITVLPLVGIGWFARDNAVSDRAAGAS